MTRELLPHSDAKTVRRAGRILSARGLQMGIVCRACATEKRDTSALMSPAIDPQTGEWTLVCGCRRVVWEGIVQ